MTEVPSLFTPPNDQEDRGSFSLLAMAQNHLQQANGSSTTQITIPDLFSLQPSTMSTPLIIPDLFSSSRESSSSIDLMSALTLSPSSLSSLTSPEDSKVSIPALMKANLSETPVEACQTLSLMLPTIPEATASAFGKVLCRKWPKSRRKRKVELLLRPQDNLLEQTRSIVPFDFSTPSPDDVVRKAQSKVFNRDFNKT